MKERVDYFKRLIIFTNFEQDWLKKEIRYKIPTPGIKQDITKDPADMKKTIRE